MTPAAYPQLLPASERLCFCPTWNSAIVGPKDTGVFVGDDECHQSPTEPSSRRLQLLDSVFVVCPAKGDRAETVYMAMLIWLELTHFFCVTTKNNKKPKQHAIWEALNAGAIPLILGASNHTDFNGLPAGHPLIFLPDLQVRKFNDVVVMIYPFVSRLIKNNSKIGIVAVFVKGKNPTTCRTECTTTTDVAVVAAIQNFPSISSGRCYPLARFDPPTCVESFHHHSDRRCIE